MKKQPKAVYIIENGGYTELTYEEFRRREQICPLYADKLFLPLYGRLMEVSKEDYTEFYRAKRRQKYLDERSADNGDFSYDMLTPDEFSGEDILIDITGPERLSLQAATIAIVGEVPMARLWHAVPAYPTMNEVWLRLLEAYRTPS